MIRITEVPVKLIDSMKEVGVKLSNVYDEPCSDIATIEIDLGIVKIYTHDKSIVIDQLGAKFILDSNEYHRVEME